MAMRIVDPVGELARAPAGRPLRIVEALDGRRLGLLWSKHAASVKFWPVLERVAEARFRPSEVHRLYKSSTWNTAPAEQLEEFTGKVDYVLVGTGA